MNVCLNQKWRPKIHVERKGIGNCTICTADGKNNKCDLYTPIFWGEADVKERTKTGEEEQERSCQTIRLDNRQ